MNDTLRSLQGGVPPETAQKKNFGRRNVARHRAGIAVKKKGENPKTLDPKGRTPPFRRHTCERRFEELCKGPVIPLEAMVEYFPISAKAQSRLYQFGKKVLSGIFLGLVAVRIWKGNIYGCGH